MKYTLIQTSFEGHPPPATRKILPAYPEFYATYELRNRKSHHLYSDKLARDNDYINDAAATVYQLSQDEMVRLQCEAREDYYRNQRDVELMLNKLSAEKEALASENKALSAENEKLLALIAEHGIPLT